MVTKKKTKRAVQGSVPLDGLTPSEKTIKRIQEESWRKTVDEYKAKLVIA